ncbi:MAG: TAT-variant-translocated molybdopterin oxidoreductase [Haliangiales bacterium]
MSSLDRGNTYWRSLEAFEAELDSNPELQERLASEFPEQAASLSDPLSRRRFMQLMSASLALAGVAGQAACRRYEREEIVPLSRRPEDYVPGNASYYATAFEVGGVADALVVTSVDGRPIKVEGNPMHPFSRGASTSFAQASVLHLYDPDRSMAVRSESGEGGWDEVEALMQGQAVANGGAGLRVLSEAVGSPTLARLRAELLQRYPQAKWYEYEPLNFDNERIGLSKAGMVPEGATGLRAMPRLFKAKRVVTIDADIFGAHPAHLRFARDFTAARKVSDVGSSGQLGNRLYAIESSFSITGAKADNRLPLPASHLMSFLEVFRFAINDSSLRNTSADDEKTVTSTVARLAKLKQAGEASAKSPEEQAVARALAVLPDSSLRFLAAMALDISRHPRESVFIAGPGLPPQIHAQVAAINAATTAQGNTIDYFVLPEGDRMGALDGIAALADEMDKGQVETLVMLGGNPAYDAPADVGFADKLAKVKTSIHLSEYDNETSAVSTWHLPRTHFLEAWGDARSYDGTISLVQPLIEPMWRDSKNRPAKSAIQLVAMLLGQPAADGQALVRETFDRSFGGGETGWRKALHDGFIAGSEYPATIPNRARSLWSSNPPPTLGSGSYEVVFLASSHAYDGRFANNGWLQETPDFITKLTWDNAALVNPNTADHMGVKQGQMVRIEVDGRSIEVPVYTLPGQARDSIAITLGHGRTHAGRVGGSTAEEVASSGFNAYPLRTSTAAHAIAGATVSATGASYQLVSTQDHWDYQDSQGRIGVEQRLPQLIRTTDPAEIAAEAKKVGNDPAKAIEHLVDHRVHVIDIPDFVPERNRESLWDEHDYDQPRVRTDGEGDRAVEIDRYRHQWGMTIDLDKCSGCNACMLACQAENNVPIVGKEQVSHSREMHWMRIDRYFSGENLRDEPIIAHQPVACQHCENAPCEQVCPVGATLHSEEGLNDMAYNRCIGTRYCLNNCPYRVRRFNFLDYQNRSEAPGGPLESARNRVRELLFNPDVTVRSRGVIEKCTFCVQRISAAKITAKNEGRERVREGEVLTACQQACPTQAIEFGDLNDQDSAVSKAQREPRSYALLGEFNTRPRTLFLARVRNPNPLLG